MPREFSRTDRVADLIQRELAMIILQEMKDPRIGLVTIAEIKISKDLVHAKVLVSILNEEHIEQTVKTLNSAAGFLRSVLSKRIAIRIVPHLFFVHDATTLQAEKLTRLIDKSVSKEDPKESPQ